MDYFEQVDLAYQTLKGPALERRLRELTLEEHLEELLAWTKEAET